MISIRNYFATIEYHRNSYYLCNEESYCSIVKKICKKA